MEYSPAKQQRQQEGQSSQQILFTPLLISVIGILSTGLALVIYHFIITRYCLRHRRRGAVSRDHSQQQSFPIDEEAMMGGVDEKVLQSIPVLAYSNLVTKQTECAVCLGELQEGDMVRLLPTCRHTFHLLCIDHWFLSHSTCPLCRSMVVGGDHIVLSCTNAVSSPSSSSSSPPTTAGVEEEHGAFHGRDRDANDSVVVPETTRPRSNRLLQHCVSLILHTEERSKPPLLPIPPIKRSLSMDH